MLTGCSRQCEMLRGYRSVAEVQYEIPWVACRYASIDMATCTPSMLLEILRDKYLSRCTDMYQSDNGCKQGSSSKAAKLPYSYPEGLCTKK